MVANGSYWWSMMCSCKPKKYINDADEAWETIRSMRSTSIHSGTPEKYQKKTSWLWRLNHVDGLVHGLCWSIITDYMGLMDCSSIRADRLGSAMLCGSGWRVLSQRLMASQQHLVQLSSWEPEMATVDTKMLDHVWGAWGGYLPG